MSTAAVFTIARTWKQPRCPSADERIRKPWYIYTMEYYLAAERNTFESVLMRWMNLELIIQSEVKSERERQILCINVLIWNLVRWHWRSYLQGNKGDADIKNRLLDSVREREGGEKEGERLLGITPTTFSDYCYCCLCFTCEVKNIQIFSNFSYIIQSICTESQTPVVFFKPLCKEASAIVDDTT